MGVLRAHAETRNLKGAFGAFEAMQEANLAPPVEAYEALMRACFLAGQPHRALSTLTFMRETAGVAPTSQCYRWALRALTDKLRAEDALRLLEEAEAEGAAVPQDALVAVMEGLAAAERPSDVMRVLRSAQSRGQLTFVDKSAQMGIFNVSGLGPTTIAALLHHWLSGMRSESSMVSAPSCLRIYHSRRARTHVRHILRAMDPPLSARMAGRSKSRKHLFVSNEWLVQWLTTGRRDATARVPSASRRGLDWSAGTAARRESARDVQSLRLEDADQELLPSTWTRVDTPQGLTLDELARMRQGPAPEQQDEAFHRWKLHFDTVRHNVLNERKRNREVVPKRPPASK
jgi:hypothetical protein